MNLFRKPFLLASLVASGFIYQSMVQAQEVGFNQQNISQVALDRQQRININKTNVSAIFQQRLPYKVVSIDLHESGLYEIVADRGIFYMNSTGDHLFNGSVHKMDEDMTNLTQEKKADVGAKVIESIKDTFITYKAPMERYEIVVFFDTSCGFCIKMHGEMSRYNAAGITVHYALYDRSGVSQQGKKTPTATELSNIACSANPAMAMNSVMRGGQVAPAKCDDPVAIHYELGQWLGVTGTPMSFGLNGKVVLNGYAPVDQLLLQLENSKG
jgi:thiol:disulfide interchange protein DsbC